MAKGSVLTAAFIDSVGLTAATYTLSSVPKVVIHPELQEPMFRIQVEEFDDTVFLDRQYCFDQRFTVPSGYGVGDKILLWMRRVTRHLNRDEKEAPGFFPSGIGLFLFRSAHGVSTLSPVPALKTDSRYPGPGFSRA